MKTKLQTFAEVVTADVLGIPLEQVVQVSDLTQSRALPGADNQAINIEGIIALIQTIMEVVMQIMGSCPNQSREAARAVARPNYFQRVRVRRAVSNIAATYDDPNLKRLSGKIADAMISRGSGTPEPEVVDIIEETVAPDNWII